ncbi:polyketide cyclase [Streptomyces sp. ISL-66]|uniref:polyketide cyclase n=1 Tax=Streptomyces sp. ISL-66 TaxID=2819186 RepID=UPI001BE57530|nr:polyketide cyclase [Streptomyces sp. ISL-66]MBT2466440.1 polyketide cyclase [Streptomyces sp. ISL-66]
MWAYEHSVETNAGPGAIWGLWADVENWGAWNADIESVMISGAFAAGAEIVMTPAGQDPVSLVVAEAVVDELFVDEARFEGLLLRTVHRVDAGERLRTRVTYRMEITGEGVDELGPHIGPAVTGDWPETMDALVKLAQG